MKNLTTIIALSVCLLSTICSAGPVEDLHAIFSDYDAWYLNRYPAEAMQRGDYSNAGRLTDNSLAAYEREYTQRVRFLDRVQSIERRTLTETDRVNAEIFEALMKRSVDGHRFRAFLMPIGSRFGPHQSIPRMVDSVRLESVGDYADLITRMSMVPKMINDVIECMNLGVAEGRVPPRVTLEGVLEQMDTLLDQGGLNRLAEPMADMPAYFDAEERIALQFRFDHEAMPAVRQAMATLRSYLAEIYIPACRESIAASDLPDGQAYYAHRLQFMTTTDMTAQEIHDLGRTEVARIRAEMMDVIAGSDFMTLRPDATAMGADERFAAFVHYLRTDSRFYYDRARDLLDGYKAICKTVDGMMPRYFGILPRQPYGVVEIPAYMAARQTTAYYDGGDLRNAQAGLFYANTYDLAQRPTYDMIALALHEAVPGHHHQIAIAREMEGLPEFRKDSWFTAYGEGWGLYAERLGIEMGLYKDPYDDFGRLGFEMWRACRLVVDTGMHALGWSRQQSIEFMMQNTALSELNIVNEVDRYIAWPAQAVAYKIGELRIRALRDKAETLLRARFNIRDFHDLILGEGAVPLSVLDRRVNDWINRQLMSGVSYD